MNARERLEECAFGSRRFDSRTPSDLRLVLRVADAAKAVRNVSAGLSAALDELEEDR